MHLQERASCTGDTPRRLASDFPVPLDARPEWRFCSSMYRSYIVVLRSLQGMTLVEVPVYIIPLSQFH